MHDDITRITIMADYGDVYAWDQKGASIGLAYNFEGNPEIKAVEDELIQWSGDFWEAEDNDPNFPWEEFHERGLALTKKLNEVIPANFDIEISYNRPFEDPKGRNKDEKIIFRKRKGS